MLPRRTYGRHQDRLSIIGLGGIVVAQLSQPEADRIVGDAFDRGVNYFDVAPTYMDAEDRLGPALRPYRQQAFLACKTEKRMAAEAEAALQTSLRKLQTDHFDLYQLHGLQSLDEAQACFASGGAMETLIAARERGLTRYLGFSAHSVEAALFCLKQFPFDSVLFPLSWPAYYAGRFGPQVVDAAASSGAAVLALKAMARRPWPDGAAREYPKCWYEPFDDPSEAERALRWTLSLPVTAAVPPGNPRLFELALRVAERFEPMTDAEIETIQAATNAATPLFAVD